MFGFIRDPSSTRAHCKTGSDGIYYMERGTRADERGDACAVRVRLPPHRVGVRFPAGRKFKHFFKHRNQPAGQPSFKHYFKHEAAAAAAAGAPGRRRARRQATDRTSQGAAQEGCGVMGKAARERT